MPRSLSYTQAAVAVVIDKVAGNKFADEFAFRVTFPDALSSLRVGLDAATTSFGANKSVQLAVSYKSVSNTNDQLLSLYYEQVRGRARLFNITVATGVGETTSYNNCSISGIEGLEGGGAEDVVRTFTMNVEEFVPDRSLF